MSEPWVYLDHNATTPIAPQVVEAMAEAAGYANPASQHRPGRQARQVLEDAREAVAALLGAAPADSLIFTSGGTEANNLAVFGLTEDAEPRRLIVSAIEHPSVATAAARRREQGWDAPTLGVSPCGVARLDELASLLQTPTRLVSLMLGNNETGAMQPVEQAAKLCHAAGSLLHTDAVQVVGKLPVRFRELGVDALSLAAHKFHGPRGAGALLLRERVQLRPQLFGGFQQAGLRPGTESVALAVGLRTALELWQSEAQQRAERMEGLRRQLETAILRGWPQAVIHSADAARLPHTLNAAFPGLNRQTLVMALDLAGVACSSGSACASGSTDPSATLVAMGCPEAILDSSIRFSLGATTTESDIDLTAERVLRVCETLARSKH